MINDVLAGKIWIRMQTAMFLDFEFESSIETASCIKTPTAISWYIFEYGVRISFGVLFFRLLQLLFQNAVVNNPEVEK